MCVVPFFFLLLLLLLPFAQRRAETEPTDDVRVYVCLFSFGPPSIYLYRLTPNPLSLSLKSHK